MEELLSSACNGSTLPKTSPDFNYEMVDPDEAIHDLTLADQSGKAVRLGDFRLRPKRPLPDYQSQVLTDLLLDLLNLLITRHGCYYLNYGSRYS